MGKVGGRNGRILLNLKGIWNPSTFSVPKVEGDLFLLSKVGKRVQTHSLDGLTKNPAREVIKT